MLIVNFNMTVSIHVLASCRRRAHTFLYCKEKYAKESVRPSYATMLRLFKPDPIVMISSCLRAITMGTPV